MLLDTVFASLWLALSFWAFLRYSEGRQWWTLRFKLSCWIPGRSVVLLSLLGISSILSDVVQSYSLRLLPTRVCVGISLTAFLFVLLRVLLPIAESRDYVDLRWKAWSGPSRTGIAPSLTRYLGNSQDWTSMLLTSRATSAHPVEAYTWLISPFTPGITHDPSNILTARLRADEEADTIWVPRSEFRAGTYAPFENDQPVSLLWGKELGFKPRCSRGIIAVPSNLLTYQPRLKNGVDGRPLCVAHGILARNKGLQPQSLICNLQANDSFRIFEENSVFWPRPAKTLRSFYHAEMTRSFSGLGDSYVTTATELALLIADAGHEITLDWLEAQLEHQDLKLNNEIAALGAGVEDLQRLYRGHYAAMLISLSLHRFGNRIRPELAVFKAVCRKEGVQDFAAWLSDPAMVERGRQESLVLGRQGGLLIQAVI